MLILALESSTTSAKAMLYCTERGVLDLLTEEYLPETSDIETQDADGVFRQMMKVGRKVCVGRKIDLIVLSGIWHSVMLCDKDMNPQTRILSWADTKAADVCNRIRSKKEDVIEYYEKTGCTVNANYPLFKLLYFKEQGYRLENYYIFGQGSYITYRLTGKRIVTDCMASGSGLMNIHTKQYDSNLLAEIGITEEQLCKIVNYRDTAPLSETGAELLGLEVGIPVMPASADGALNQVGVGALEEGVMTFSVGTSAAIRLTTAKPIIPDEPSTWCYLSPTMWLTGAATSGACNCTDWFIDNFYQSSYENIEKDIQHAKDTPVFLPFIFGERSPGWQDEKRGAFIGIQPYHSKEDFYLAVQEGILFNVFQCYKMLSELNGIPRRIILSGGILHSKSWTQMCADIFGTRMETPTVEQSSLMGAIVLALDYLGVIQSPNDFVFGKGEIIIPNQDMTEVYQKKYQRYQYWYEKTKL